MGIRRKGYNGGHTSRDGFRDRAVQMLPYEVRLRNYERDKDELFYRMPGMTSDQIHSEVIALARKWQV